MKRTIAKLLLALAALLITAAIADRALGWLGVDWRLVEASLHYNQADVPLYQGSDDPVLHYHMSPGATHGIHAGPYSYDASVNRWGARGLEHPADKPQGTTRILYFGASSIFGANVSDHETLPARLEQRLPEAGSAPVEVWNYGHSGYVASQIARLAIVKLDEAPAVDLVLVTVTNAFPRPFLPPWPVNEADNRPEPSVPAGPPVDNRAHFERDPSHWTENFSDVPLRWLLGERFADALHAWALRASPGYRCLRASSKKHEGLEGPNATTMALSERELTQLEAHAGKLGIPVVYVNHPEHDGQREPGTRGRVLELWQEGQDAGYYEVHPPAPFLDAWALHLAQDLLLGGLVPTIPVAEPGPEI